MSRPRQTSGLLCPSARPESPEAAIFGVVDRSTATPEVRYLREPAPLSDDLLGLLQGASPGEVWRIGAPCAGSGCLHFDGVECSLGERLVQLGSRSAEVPRCALRAAGCRWFHERGPAACKVCCFVLSDAPGATTGRAGGGERGMLASPHRPKRATRHDEETHAGP